MIEPYLFDTDLICQGDFLIKHGFRYFYIKIFFNILSCSSKFFKLYSRHSYVFMNLPIINSCINTKSFSNASIRLLNCFFLFAFICLGEGELFEKSNESSDIKWIAANELKLLLETNPKNSFL